MAHSPWRAVKIAIAEETLSQCRAIDVLPYPVLSAKMKKLVLALVPTLFFINHGFPSPYLFPQAIRLQPHSSPV